MEETKNVHPNKKTRLIFFKKILYAKKKKEKNGSGQRSALVARSASAMPNSASAMPNTYRSHRRNYRKAHSVHLPV